MVLVLLCADYDFSYKSGLIICGMKEQLDGIPVFQDSVLALTLSFISDHTSTLLRSGLSPVMLSTSSSLSPLATTSPIVTESAKQLVWQTVTYLVCAIGNSIRYP